MSLQSAKVSGGLNLLLLDSVLNGLLVNQLLELLLLSDQEMVLMSVSLGRDGVESCVRVNIYISESNEGMKDLDIPGATF